MVTTKAKIYRANFDGSNTTVFLPTAIPGDPYCLSFDWIARNLYVGNRISQSIEVVTTKQQNQSRAVILSNNGAAQNGVLFPVSIAVHPQKGLLFWLDNGGPGFRRKIGRVELDGKNPKEIVTTGLMSMDFMTIDLQSNVIYYTEGQNGLVCTFIDGT